MQITKPKGAFKSFSPKEPRTRSEDLRSSGVEDVRGTRGRAQNFLTPP